MTSGPTLVASPLPRTSTSVMRCSLNVTEGAWLKLMGRLDPAIASAAKTSMTIDEINPRAGSNRARSSSQNRLDRAVIFHYVNSRCFCKERLLSPQGFIQ